MENALTSQVLDLLAASLEGGATKDAAAQLEGLIKNEGFAASLISIASHQSVPLPCRQAALLQLKQLIVKTWSSSLEEYDGETLQPDATKPQIRQSLLALATSAQEDKKITSSASYCISKIASCDFPEQWPDLLSILLDLVPRSNERQLHAVLVLLGNLIEEGFDENQFHDNAIQLITCLRDVTADPNKRLTTRALAVSSFRACFDTIELIYETDQQSIKQLMRDAADTWLPLFIDILRAPLPRVPTADEETEGESSTSIWRGTIALKTQVVKALDKIRNLFPHLLESRLLQLFGDVWAGLQAHLEPYVSLYVTDDRQGRMEDADRLPYTLDFLVMEELDFMHSIVGHPSVRGEIEKQLTPETLANGSLANTWLSQVIPVLVGYSQITADDEGMWEVDVNVFLAEETAETANYSPRSACSNFGVRLCTFPIAEALLAYHDNVFSESISSAKSKEACLYMLKQILDEFVTESQSIQSDLANRYSAHVRASMIDSDDLLRARAFSAAAILSTSSEETLSPMTPELCQITLDAITNDASDLVKVTSIRGLQEYFRTFPRKTAEDFQVKTVAVLSAYVSVQDPEELKEGEELLDCLVQTLRDAIMAAPEFAISHPALDLLFTLGSYGANNFQTCTLIEEGLESVAVAMADLGAEAYAQLCAKVLPSLIGALDVGDITSENALSDLALRLLSVLAENGLKPLPAGFVATIMPKLYRLIFSNVDFNLHQVATVVIKHVLVHDAEQVFSWQDPETNKSGLEIVLLIIDRLLSPDIEDISGAEVGGLAVELVEKAGYGRLGPFLSQLLQVVAIRLSTATHAIMIQNLVLVFARLCLANAQDVVEFLSQVHVNGPAGGSGLEVVMRKWLENSANFAGYEEIRQNVVALGSVYKLQDPRLSDIMVQGDLVVPNTSRIKTRSMAKKEPDEYTIVSAPLKLIKVLVAELVFPSSPTRSFTNKKSSADGGSSEGDDGEWEDVPNVFLDLGNPTTRQELMSLADESRWDARQYDDETHRYLLAFFHEMATKPTFQEQYHSLTDEERAKLSKLEQSS